MDTDDLESFEDITKIKTYADFLDKFVTKEDLIYLEDEELARDVKELYAVNKGGGVLKREEVKKYRGSFENKGPLFLLYKHNIICKYHLFAKSNIAIGNSIRGLSSRRLKPPPFPQERAKN